MGKTFKTIVIGAGFGGINATIELGKAQEEALIIEKTNHHLFQPLLYQVASAGLSAVDISSPVREIVENYNSVSSIMDEVKEIDLESKMLSTKSGLQLHFENLIIAVGNIPTYFGNDSWKDLAPSLKSLKDAIEIRENILKRFEEVELDSVKGKPVEVNFVIVGGGPTGVEMAGAIAEIAKKTLANNFKNFNPKDTNVYLIESGDRVLSSFDESLSANAKKVLEEMGVKVLLNQRVKEITEDLVRTDEMEILTKNVVWAAGNTSSPLTKKLACEKDDMGRVIVNNDCSIEGYEKVYVIGDAAAFKENESFLPGLAPVAIQQGKFVAKKIIGKYLENKKFEYFDKGTMATIGKSSAVLEFKKIKMTGFFAWIAWCFVHLLFLVKFRNKIIVFIEWVFYYFSNSRGSRIIKGDE